MTDASERSNPPAILVVDDDPAIVRQLEWALGDTYRVVTASDRGTALSIYQSERMPVILLDLGLPPCPREATEGFRALEEFLSIEPLVKVIIVSGNAERANALLAVERGAHDIFPKPIDMDELRIVLKRVFARARLEKEAFEAQTRAARFVFEDIVGESPEMRTILSDARKVAPSDVPLLITGESGTGKELLATAIHSLSPRKDGPFVAINCAAIPETLLESELFGHEKGAFTGANTQRKGRLEYAEGGTLFLDEIGEIAPALQVKILRFLQDRVIERVGGRTPIPVDSRVIAATNRDLEQAVRDGKFREDLYFRVAVVRMYLPPLRDRGDDVMRLAEHFLEIFVRELKKPPKRLSRAAVDAVRAHTWPGNVRELQNRLKRAVLLSDGPLVQPEDLELGPRRRLLGPAPLSLKAAKEDLERDLVRRALEESGGNVSKAARALGVSRPTLYDLMGKYALRDVNARPS